MASKLQNKIKEAVSNLPDEYREAIGNTNVTRIVENIATDFGLSPDEADHLDREVTYLLLRMHRTQQFMARIEQKLDITEQTVAKITDRVTNRLIQPIIESMSDEEITESVPIPPPPPNTDMPDSTSYGGASDPYREPVDD